MSTQSDSQDSTPQYDAHIIPAESVARQHREGKDFGHTSHEEADGELSQATEGYTVDKEGLLNNYAIEPEMYINVPGDMREQAAQEKAEHAHEMQELSEDEDGKLTKEHDWRHKGPGLI
ncbi:MAG: hypothetical protein KME07_09875 [Pegethrix bostrychoides GSE-TBD4-15B]|jgi:hypothetical protein|uniref:Uncharacterized protein n=1 Tax=Pegethrix bostrychoides GSE-TBD4-15B TaxID=2839662 RepID=A0A951P9U5_9CYAN|nr:hypothetical protein [Pegethrix bostrychoides GSE-TBD4-15B]